MGQIRVTRTSQHTSNQVANFTMPLHTGSKRFWDINELVT